MKRTDCPYCGWPNRTMHKVVYYHSGPVRRRKRFYVQCNHCLYRGKESVFKWLARKHYANKNGTMTIRRERVQDISEADAKAEGVTPINDSKCGYRGAFRELWNALNAKRGYDWYTNNWVWVYTFERMEINSKEAGKPAATYAHQQILKEA